ncbi:MAG: hypothetical protein RL662_1541 [Bacteroidota bacterium]
MNTRLIILILFFVINIINMLIIEHVDNEHSTVWVITLFCSIFFILNFEFSFKKNFLQITVLSYIFACHTLLPILIRIGFLDLNEDRLYVQNNISLYLYLTFFIVYLFSRNFIKNQSVPYNTLIYKKNKTLNKKWIYTFFIVIFMLTSLSYILGIGRMGAETIELPFKLTGFLNNSRTIFAPFLFVILYDKIKKTETKVFLLKVVVLFFLWCVYETFVRLSRSAMIEYLLPFILYTILSQRLTFAKINKYIIPLLVLNFALYPIITQLRSFEGKVNILAIQEVRDDQLENKNSGIYFRIFSNARFIDKYIPYLSEENFFSFHNLNQILYHKGSHNFTTAVVDDLHLIQKTHSSGTTGIGDALLIGGKGFAIITFAIVAFIAIYFDNPRMQDKYFLRILGFVLIRGLVMMRSWSLLFSPMVIFSLFILYLILKKYQNESSTLGVER